MLKDVMRKERVNEDEVHAVIRKNGLSSIDEAGAVVLETDGSLTLIRQIDSLNTATMGFVGTPEIVDKTAGNFKF